MRELLGLVNSGDPTITLHSTWKTGTHHDETVQRRGEGGEGGHGETAFFPSTGLNFETSYEHQNEQLLTIQCLKLYF